MTINLTEGELAALIKSCVEEALEKIGLVAWLKNQEEVLVIHEEDSIEKYGDGRDYGYDSWLDYWEKEKGYKLNYSKIKCPCCGEPMTDPDGAHVVLDGKTDEVFIVPVCSSCNSKAAKNEEFRRTPFKVKRMDLVPFDLSKRSKLKK